MKIVFWGEGTVTSNLIATAGYLAYHSDYRIVMMQTQPGLCSLRENFLIRKQEQVRERSLPIDVLLSVGTGQGLSEKLVLRQLEPIVKNHFYSFTLGREIKRNYDLTEVHALLERITDVFDKYLDFTFIDCGRRTDAWTQQMIKNADLVVINFEQSKEGLDAFFLQYANLSANVVYLISNYQKESIYNKNWIERMYRIPCEQLAAVPFNPEFWKVCKDGHLSRYLKKSPYETEWKRNFMQELELAMQVLLREKEIRE